MINVLVVDDQNLTLRLIETYLKPEPEIKIVGIANNGHEALEQVNTLQPDIVLMDVEMPRMNGLAATKIITQNSNPKTRKTSAPYRAESHRTYSKAIRIS